MIQNSVRDTLVIRSLKDAVNILSRVVQYLHKGEPDNFTKRELRDVAACLRAVENAEKEVGSDVSKRGIG